MKFFVGLLLLVALATAARADDDAERLTAAREAAAHGDLDAALDQLAPLLERDPTSDENAARARRAAANLLHQRGTQRFRDGKIHAAIADYDREIALVPELAPGHWQRGIAYYYSEDYQQGVEQFELHQTVNPEDVENAVWHFLCAVRAPQGTVAAARKDLIPISQDSRVPMQQIHQMFAGTATPQEVLRAVENEGARAKFYADLYVGLYFEALGQESESLRHITAAATSPAAEGSNMGDIARVHRQLRSKKSSALDR